MNKNSSINEVQSTYPQANVKAQRQDCCKNLAETQKMCAESTFLKYRSEVITNAHQARSWHLRVWISWA